MRRPGRLAVALQDLRKYHWGDTPRGMSLERASSSPEKAGDYELRRLCCAIRRGAETCGLCWPEHIGEEN